MGLSTAVTLAESVSVPLPAPSFALLPPKRLRAWPGLAVSLFVHAMLIFALLHLRTATTDLQKTDARAGLPFQIRIGDKLYYVTPTAPAPKPDNRIAKGKSGAPAPERFIELPLPEPEQPGGSSEPVAKAPAVPARAFVPPKPMMRSPSKIVLIEPDVDVPRIPPPELVPKAVAWTATHIKVPPKPFVQPGVRPQPAMEAPKEISPANITITDPNVRHVANPRLPVPAGAALAAVPLTQPPQIETAAGAMGDAVRVLAYGPFNGSDEALTVPRGNLVIGPEANGASDHPQFGNDKGAKAAANASGGGASTTKGTPKGGTGRVPSSIAGTGLGSGGGTGTAIGPGRGDLAGMAGAAVGSGVAGGTGTGLAPGSGSGAGGTGTASAGAGSGTGSANSAPGGAGTGSGLNISASASIGTRPAGTAGTGMDPSFVRITKPSDGIFDAVVVQSSAIDVLEQNRTYLTGRPVYTVFLSMGTAKDWILQYCVAREGNATLSPSGHVVTIAAPVAPIGAPFPTLMYRPAIVLRAGERYMLVHGVVTAKGKIEQVHILRHGSAETDHAISTALGGWEFRPATRDKVPIEVEFLLAIPPDRS